MIFFTQKKSKQKQIPWLDLLVVAISYWQPLDEL